MSYLEPTTYENIVNLVQKNDPQAQFPDMTPEEVDELGLYEDLDMSNSPVSDQGIYYNQPENRNPDTEIRQTSCVKRSPSMGSGFIQQLHAVIPRLKPFKTVSSPPVKSVPSPPAQTVSSPPVKTLSSPPVKTLSSPPVKSVSSPPVKTLSSPQVKSVSNPPPIAPKPIFNQIKKQEPSSDIQSEFSPPLPARKTSLYKETKAKQEVGLAHKYTNIRPTTRVPPTRKLEERSNTKLEESQRNLQVVRSKEDVAKLTVNEVCEYLKLLNLSEYEEKFRHHMIDGVLLQALKSDMFKEDVGMKGIEVVRLMNFSKEGRLPAQN